jgi:transglutaminase-like putative cysteine protease
VNLPGKLFDWLWSGMRRRFGLRGIAAILLLALALRAVSGGLAEVLVGLDPGRAAFTSFSAIAVVAGWELGRSRRWPIGLGLWLAAGFAAVLFQNAGLWGELFEIVRTGAGYGFEWIVDRLGGQPLNRPAAFEPLRLAWLRLSGGVRIELDVLGSWFSGLFAGEPSFRAEAVAFAWGIVLWILGLYAGLVMHRRGEPLWALLPAGLVLAIAFAHTGEQRMLSLVVFLMASLLLTAVQTQYRNERRWADRMMMYAEDLRLDFTFAASLLVGLILALTYVVPQIRIGPAIRAFIDRSADPLPGPAEPGQDPGEALGLPRPSPPPPFFDQFRQGGLPTSHLLGAGPELAEEVALTIRVFGEADPGGTRYYWRGLSYEIYLGPGWSTRETETFRYQAGWRLPLPELQYSRPVRQEVRVVGSVSPVAYAAGEIVSADRVISVAWRAPGPPVPDVFGVRMESETYTLDSSYPYLFSDLLRAAGTGYPDWVAEGYLALPDTVPERVHELADSLTAEAENPFDAALAIEAYLRGFEYTLELGPPPPDRDLVDYFLFDLQRGYCDYFATAMVVLARSAGIPARLAVGYAGGTYDPETERYIVSALNAHSWPELYFPGFGWVPFEPTAGVGAIDRSGDAAIPAVPPPDLPPLRAAPPGWLRTMAVGAGVAAGLLAVVIFVRAMRERVRIRRLEPEAFFTEAFQWLYGAGRDLPIRIPTRATPIELGRSLWSYLESLQARNRLARRLPSGELELALLTDAYIRSLFSRESPGEGEKAAGIRSLRRLRGIVWFAKIEAWIGRSLR